MKYIKDYNIFLNEKAYLITGIDSVVDMLKKVRSEVKSSKKFISLETFVDDINDKLENINISSIKDEKTSIELLFVTKDKMISHPSEIPLYNAFFIYKPSKKMYYASIIHTLNVKDFFINSTDSDFLYYLKRVYYYLEHELIHFNQTVDIFRLNSKQKEINDNLTFFEKFKKYGLRYTNYYSSIMEIEAGAATTVRELQLQDYTKDDIKKLINDINTDQKYVPSEKYKQIYKTFFKNKAIWNLYLNSLDEYNNILSSSMVEMELNEIVDPISITIITLTLLWGSLTIAGSRHLVKTRDNAYTEIEKSILIKNLGKDYESKILIIDEILKKYFDDNEINEIKFNLFNSKELQDVYNQISKEKDVNKKDILYKDSERILRKNLSYDQYNRFKLCANELNKNKLLKYKI